MRFPAFSLVFFFVALFVNVDNRGISHNSASAASVCVGPFCVNAPTGGGRSYRGSSSRGSSSSQPRWSSSFINDKQSASNNHGLKVTYDDAGELILLIDVKQPIPHSKPNMAVPVRIDIGRRGNFSSNAVMNEHGTMLTLSGPVVYSVASGMKSGSRVKVVFIGNDYTVRLRGSRDAIEQVEMAAKQWKLIRKDRIDDARKDRAEKDIAERPQQRVDTLQVADDTNRGVRPKDKLQAGSRKVSDIRVQYYVPGTREIGEMWVEWDVDNNGPYIGMNFIDPDHKYEQRAHSIRMPFQKGRPACEKDLAKEPDVSTADCRFIRAVLKADSWAKKLDEKKYRKSISKTVANITGKKGDEKSFSVVFKRYEDGGYAVQIDDSKFGISKLFNFTLENGLALARITQDAVNEANNATISEEDVDDLLQ
jgi:hypothetical protein